MKRQGPIEAVVRAAIGMGLDGDYVWLKVIY